MADPAGNRSPAAVSRGRIVLRVLHPAIEAASVHDEGDDGVDAVSCLDVREHERTISAHTPGIAVHHLEAGSDQRRKIDLVDHQQVAAGDARTALAGNLVASGNIDHVDRDVSKFGAEGCGKIVAAGLDQQQIQPREPAGKLGTTGKIDAGILPDGGVRAAAGLDAHDALGSQRAGAREELRILARVNVIGDRSDLEAIAEGPAKSVHQRGLAGTDRATDADAQGSMSCHVRKSLV